MQSDPIVTRMRVSMSRDDPGIMSRMNIWSRALMAVLLPLLSQLWPRRRLQSHWVRSRTYRRHYVSTT